MLAPENLGADYAAEFNSLYPRLADEFNTSFIPFFLQDVALVPALNQPDGLHPNRAGIDVIVQNLMPELLVLLASRGEQKG
jgi:acyl-CoA thioesterase-1